MREAKAPCGQSSRLARTRPGSRPDPGLAPGGETGRRAPPFLARVRGTAAAGTCRQQLPLTQVRSDKRGRGGARAPVRGGRL